MTGVLNPVDSFNVRAGAVVGNIRADIITGSLNALNSGSFSRGGGSSLQSAMNDSYDFNKSVLSAGYGGGDKGVFLDSRSGIGSSMQSAMSASYDSNKSVPSAEYGTRGLFINL